MLILESLWCRFMDWFLPNPCTHHHLEGFSGYDLMMGAAAKPRSPHWPTVRKHFLEQNPTCAACGGTEFLACHHKLPFHIHPELELDFRNLVTLCESPTRLCHFRTGHSYDWKAYNEHVIEDAALSLLRITTRKYERGQSCLPG